MRIKSLKYIDHSTGWRLDKTEFGGLSLLVGISGVGKTKILEAIRNLQEVSFGKTLNGVEWEIEFSDDNNNYIWSGEFDTKEYYSEQVPEKELHDTEKRGKFKILKERLNSNDKEVFVREHGAITFNKVRMPRLPSDVSCIELFKEEEVITPVVKAFRKLVNTSYLSRDGVVNAGIYDAFKEIGSNIERLKDFGSWITLKLALAEQLHKDIFNKIVSDFITIFPGVEQVSYREDSDDSDNFLLSIREKNTDWIDCRSISSGMLKTLFYLAELELAPDGSVMLIDEFENSLGVNCIDTVAEYITDSERDIQFIITSHHPYIINNIGMQHWKIVQRQGSRVFTSTAEELKLGRSKHEAFKQLMNSSAYEHGIS